MAVFRIHPDVKYSPCRLAATAFLSDTLLIQPHSSSQTRDNRSVILFLPSFPFFFSRLFILIIFNSLPRHRYRANKSAFMRSRGLKLPRLLLPCDTSTFSYGQMQYMTGRPRPRYHRKNPRPRHQGLMESWKPNTTVEQGPIDYRHWR